MRQLPRRSRSGFACWCAVLAVGCSRAPTATTPPVMAPPPDPLAAGCGYLAKHQSDDGAWRSDVYATFKDGTALTPLVACALQDADRPEDIVARRKAVVWLARRVKADGTIDEGPDGFPYPVYTAALTLACLHHRDYDAPDPEVAHARKAWRKYLLDRQLTEANGWHPDDKQYGGWGYYPRVPKKPAPGEMVPAQQLLESNLSATTFALDALAAAGVTDQKVLGPARRFVEACQNADGGFHFIYDDPVRNKAGTAAIGDNGNRLFHSYGSATADGVRALLRCGAKPDDPKVLAGRAWLERHFAADRHPGEYIPTHERNRDAVYFYYARSVAKTLRLLGVKDINGRHWADQLAEALVARQTPDHLWANPADQQRENDPLLATAYAVSALAECRKAGR